MRLMDAALFDRKTLCNMRRFHSYQKSDASFDIQG